MRGKAFLSAVINLVEDKFVEIAAVPAATAPETRFAQENPIGFRLL